MLKATTLNALNTSLDCRSLNNRPTSKRYADAIVGNSRCYARRVLLVVPSLYYNMPKPQHGFPSNAAVMNAPSPDYHLVSESPALPALQPIEIVRQPAGAVTVHDGMREDGLSTAMRTEVTPPGYVVRRHQHLPAFSGKICVGG